MARTNKVCLVKIDLKSGRKDNYPLSLAYLASALKSSGFEPVIFHCTEDEVDSVVEEIAEIKPLYAGFSVITGAQIKAAVYASRKIKKMSAIPVVWGGIHPSLLPEQCISEEYIDVIAIGEGEETAVEIAQKLKNSQPLDNVRGIFFKKNGRIIKNEPRPFLKLGQYKLDFSIIDIKNYFHELDEFKRGIDYMTSRGCPHCCAFCYNLKFNRRSWRPFPKEQVISDIGFLKKKYGVDAVYFLDDNFYVQKDRAFEILEAIGLPSYTEVRIDYVDEAFVKRLKKLRPRLVLIGAESGSDRVLKLIRKGFDVERLMKGVELFAKYHIPVHYSFILGFPTETREETEKTIDFMLWIRKAHKESAFTVGHYMPYPGSELYELAIKEGFKPPKTTEGWHKVDRWASELNLPWIDTRYCYYVRWYFFFIYTRVPFIQKICEWRLKTRNFFLPIDLKLMMFLYNYIKFRNTSIFAKALKRTMEILQKK